MKILHVYKDYYPVVGGIENHIRLICRGLSAYPEFQSTVLVTNRGTKTVEEEIEGVRVIKTGRLATISSAPISLGLFRWMRRLDQDITHLHFPYPIGEMAYLVAGRSRKMVITYHSDIVRQKYLLQVYKPFLYRLLARADRITVSSPQYIQSSPYLRPLRGKCTVIPHGTDLSRFASTEQVGQRVREIRGLYSPPLILFVGLLRYYKGLSFLIEAMPHIKGRLLVVGEGPQGMEWRALTHQLGLDGKVTFLGRVSDDELVALYNACDVFVLPAIHRSESWGAVQVEAMACGKPVVCTELGTGTSFVNVDGETGRVVPPRDSAALARALNELLGNDALRMEMGRKAARRAAEEFSYTVMVERLVQFYRSVISDPAGG
jgi:rhamnosyl/mannosyltransferase